MRSLPEGFRAYRRTPTFTEETVPKGLLRQHTTRAGSWAVIVVLEGSLTYRILGPEPEELLLTPDRTGVVEPHVPHEVSPGESVKFYVEFYRADED